MWVGSDSLWTGDGIDIYRFNSSKDRTATYEPIGSREVLRIERCEDVLDTWKEYYSNDPLYDHLRERRPPVKRVRAVSWGERGHRGSLRPPGSDCQIETFKNPDSTYSGR